MTRIEQLKHYLSSTPNDCFLKHALALEYMKVEEWKAAEDLFEENLREDEHYIATYYHYAGLARLQGNLDKAKGLYKRGIAVAKEQGDSKTLGELQAAQELLDGE